MEGINPSSLAYGNALLLFCVLVEMIIMKFHYKEELPWKEIVNNLNSGHILLWIFRGLEVVAYYYTWQHFSNGLVLNIPYWAQWLLGFILWDFFFYWLHRTHHYFALLWSVHVVHHEGEHFGLSLGIRNSWFSSLTSFPYFIGMAAIGIPVEIFVSVSSIHYFIQFYNHSHIIKSSGWLDYIMVTPKHHRVHHGKNDPYIDKNFGGTLVLWDKLFGTFQNEDPNNPIEIGIDHKTQTSNPIFVNLMPIINYLKIPFNFIQKNNASLTLPNSLLGSGGILLFLYLIHFTYFENTNLGFHKIWLFTTIFMGTVASGLQFDQKKIGTYLWWFSMTAMPIIFIMTNPPNQWSIYVLATISSLHATLCVLKLMK